MFKIVLKFVKIKHTLLCIASTVTIVTALQYIIYNLSFKTAFGIPFAIAICIGAGHWGLFGYIRGVKVFKETPEYYDFITLLIVGIGFFALMALVVICVLTYYNDKIISGTFGLGSIVVGGILRLYDHERYKDRRLKPHKDQSRHK